MGFTDLRSELHTLSRADKVRAMSFLVQELAEDEDVVLTPSAVYEVWSPYDTAGAADKLREILKAAKTTAGE